MAKKRRKKMPRDVEKFIHAVMTKGKDPFLNIMLAGVMRDAIKQLNEKKMQEAMKGLSPMEKLIQEEVKWMKQNR